MLALAGLAGHARADLPPGPPPQPKPQPKPPPTVPATASAKPPASAKVDAGRADDVTPEDVHARAARIARAKVQREVELTRVKKAMAGRPMDDGLREELKMHARRVARLERVRAVAKEAKDDASAERAAKLLDTEAARHEAFLASFEAKAKGGAR